jgi:hypothetical protein
MTVLSVVNMELKYDVYAASLNKAGEQICSGLTETKRLDGGVGILLAGGLGSGSAVGLQAETAAELILSMAGSGKDLSRIIGAVAGGNESGLGREVDCRAFTLMYAGYDGAFSAVVFNMPEPVLLRHGKHVALKTDCVEAGLKQIKTMRFDLMPYDTLAAFSDGVTKAGVGCMINLGFGQKSVVSYLQAAYKPHISSERLVTLLLAVCNSLYLGKPGDDVSVIVMRAQSVKSAALQPGGTKSGKRKIIA